MKANLKPKKKLIDGYGRRIRKLRVSLLDACNFRCFYCMPKNPKFMHQNRWLKANEIQGICSKLVSHGLEEVRLTGGEPTLRPDFQDIVTRLSNINLQKLGVTTNGYKLYQLLPFLKETQCQHINVSLDSLNRENFNQITNSNHFDHVIRSIREAQKLGFHVKTNTVLMRGINDHEIEDFIRFSSIEGVEVRFIEVMKIGQACDSQNKLFISAKEAIRGLQETTLTPEIVKYDSTSFNFRTKSGARIGFIASESQSFCHSCSRWRLSADGFLRACLMSPEGIHIRRAKPEALNKAFKRILTMKPYRRIERVGQYMNEIGG